MSKIMFESIIKSKENGNFSFNGKGIKKDNNILFFENDVKVDIEILSDKIILDRYSDNYDLKLLFNKNKKMKSLYFIKDLNLPIKIETITHILDVSDNKIKIDYELYMNGEYSDNFIYELEWRDIK